MVHGQRGPPCGEVLDSGGAARDGLINAVCDHDPPGTCATSEALCGARRAGRGGDAEIDGAYAPFGKAWTRAPPARVLTMRSIGSPQSYLHRFDGVINWGPWDLAKINASWRQR